MRVSAFAEDGSGADVCCCRCSPTATTDGKEKPTAAAATTARISVCPAVSKAKNTSVRNEDDRRLIKFAGQPSVTGACIHIGDSVQELVGAAKVGVIVVCTTGGQSFAEKFRVKLAERFPGFSVQTALCVVCAPHSLK